MTQPLLIIALVSSCVRLPHVDPRPRGYVDQDAASVRVESMCVLGDPFPHEVGNLPSPSADPFTLSAGLASGVIVTERHILTAQHVVACPTLPAVAIVLADGRRYRVSVDREDLAHDLALLELASADRLPVRVPPTISRVAIGDAVCAVVATPKREHHCGPVEALDASHGNVVYAAVTDKGNSGAGVYDSDGGLVGIVSAGCVGDVPCGAATAIPAGILP